MKKKIMAVTLCLAMVSTFAVGCGQKNETDSGKSEEKSSGKVEIEFVQVKREAAESYTKVIEAFEKENPDIVIKQNVVPDAQEVLMTRAIDETMAALEEMKRKGYIRYVGVSNFTAEQIKEAEQYIQIDVQQPLYSMVDRGFEDLMSWGYDRGIDSMTYGSMGAGILSGKIRSVPSFEKNDLRLNFYDVYKEPKFSKIMELLKVMDSIADGHNVPVGQVALNWSTQKEYVGTALLQQRRMMRKLLLKWLLVVVPRRSLSISRNLICI